LIEKLLLKKKKLIVKLYYKINWFDYYFGVVESL